jgi:hypothetical protein
MPSEPSSASELELGHVLFMDIVGYSKLLVDEQSDLSQQVNQIVRNTEQVRRAEAKGKLVRLPTGDGMALVFFTSPEAPMKLCAGNQSCAQGIPGNQTANGASQRSGQCHFRRK